MKSNKKNRILKVESFNYHSSFGDKNRLPLDLLKKSNIEYIINPLNKKLNEEELIKMIVDFDAIIAGTEKISEKVLNKANKLKHISRVGIELIV